ncbi:MAG: HtaA domain-containing protein, partial [Thermoleophilia bacterium]|nr:HtaA domain-containing protein [Thermoleophilia bacterium]
PAHAATYPVGGGATSLRLDAGTGAALTSLGIRVHKAGPATATRGGFRFPVNSGRIDGDSAAGVINHRGGLVLRGGGTRVVLSNFRIITSNGTPRIVGRVNGSRAFAPLFNLDLSKAAITRKGLSTVVTNVGVTLHPRGAAALRAAFRSDAFAAGLAMGRANVVAKPRDAVFTGGDTQLAVSDAALGALTTLGITPGAAADATLEGATYAFPITGGSVRLSNLAGSITHSGGITLTKAATTVTLSDFTIDTRRAQLWGKVNGSDAVALLDLDLSSPTVSTGKQSVTVAGVPGTLTEGAASALNGAFGTTAFTKGLLLGTATVGGTTA